MKRRSFLKTSLFGTSVATMLPAISQASETEANKKSKREFYEMRVYTLKNKEQERIVEDYFEKAAIPALNNLGCKNVGVFKELKPDGQTKIYVVMPFKTMDELVQAEIKMSADDDYLEAASGYLDAPLTAPAYERIESSLHISFARMPKIILPEKEPRIFELRRYESVNEMAGKKKIEMYNEAGGIEIYKRLGFNPVFFGEQLIGGSRTNITFLLTYNNMAAHDRALKWFGKDPEWKKLNAMPQYADENIISRITTTFLVPANCSQM